MTTLAALVTFRPLSMTLIAELEEEILEMVGCVELSIFLRYPMLHIRTASTQPPGCVALVMH
jgi:hypothetical protein